VGFLPLTKGDQDTPLQVIEKRGFWVAQRFQRCGNRSFFNEGFSP
jgi:hypothetical protein